MSTEYDRRLARLAMGPCMRERGCALHHGHDGPCEEVRVVWNIIDRTPGRAEPADPVYVGTPDPDQEWDERT